MADGAACFRQDSSGPALLRVPTRITSLRVRGSHPVPPAFPCRSASNAPPLCRPYNPGRPVRPPVWAPPRSLAATWGITVVFSSCGYLDVSVPRVRPHFRGYRTSLCGGLPHSEIRGSMAICASPRLIAACHVLLRRQEPGHPLCALCNLLDFLLVVSLRPHRSHAARPSFSSFLLFSFQPVKELSRRDLTLPAWRMTDSNRRPPACKAGALAS